MENCARQYLATIGYTVNDNALNIISACDDWYCGREIEDFHSRKNLNGEEVKLKRMNFAKRCCADDANLCEVISVTPEDSDNLKTFVDEFIDDNGFRTEYRKQLEKMTATGTVGAYIYLDGAEFVEQATGITSVRGGQIKINYVDADGIIPLTVENGKVTECAFTGSDLVNGKKQTTLVIFMHEDGKYYATTVIFNDRGEKITEQTLLLGDVRPFALMYNAEVNNLDKMVGYGLPKLYNAIPMLMVTDLCYNVLFGDVERADKIVFINEALAEFDPKTGKPRFTHQQKKLFMFLGEKIPESKTLIQEYNPTIRVDEVTKTFELALSLLSMTFGYGTRKYTFDNGQIQTATEYMGEKQDELQELNKQRKVASAYIKDLVRAAVWFANTFQGAHYNVDEGILVEFDDSYIEDKASRLEQMRVDAISFPEIPWLKRQYIKEKYHLTNEEVDEVVINGAETIEEYED